MKTPQTLAILAVALSVSGLSVGAFAADPIQDVPGAITQFQNMGEDARINTLDDYLFTFEDNTNGDAAVTCMDYALGAISASSTQEKPLGMARALLGRCAAQIIKFLDPAKGKHIAAFDNLQNWEEGMMKTGRADVLGYFISTNGGTETPIQAMKNPESLKKLIEFLTYAKNKVLQLIEEQKKAGTESRLNKDPKAFDYIVKHADDSLNSASRRLVEVDPNSALTLEFPILATEFDAKIAEFQKKLPAERVGLMSALVQKYSSKDGYLTNSANAGIEALRSLRQFSKKVLELYKNNGNEPEVRRDAQELVTQSSEQLIRQAGVPATELVALFGELEGEGSRNAIVMFYDKQIATTTEAASLTRLEDFFKGVVNFYVKVLDAADSRKADERYIRDQARSSLKAVEAKIKGE